jgi:hypothetical protein
MKRKNLLLTVMAALLTFGSGTVNAQTTDYQEIDLSTVTTSVLYGSPTISGNTISFSANGDELGIDVSSIAFSSYNYLVIVPKKPYISGTSSKLKYGFIDGSTDANDIYYWGHADWNTFREFTYNLTNKAAYDDYSEETSAKARAIASDKSSKTIDLSKLKTLYFKLDSKGEDFEISSIFVTNNKPSYDNRWNYQNGDYKRAIITKDTYGTICLPYVASICGADAYEVAGVDDETTPTKIYLTAVKGLLKAGTPYIFKTNTAQVGTDANVGGNVTFLRASSSSVTEPVTTKGLVGSFEDNKSVPTGCYILTNNTWETGATGTVNLIDKYRAYLNLSGLQKVTGGAASYTAVDLTGGVVTGINAVKSDKTDSKTVYNLNGMPVSNPTKGLYIENGKKIMVK